MAEIIALGWFASIIVTFYNDLAWKAKVKPRKPFSCQMCMGFWIGLSFELLTVKPFSLFPILIFSLLTSLSATLLHAIIRRI